jgi:hypothetical protein
MFRVIAAKQHSYEMSSNAAPFDDLNYSWTSFFA